MQLRATKEGFVVLDNPLHAPPRGIRRTELDRDLNVIRQSETDSRISCSGSPALRRSEIRVRCNGDVCGAAARERETGGRDVRLPGAPRESQDVRVTVSDWGEPKALAPGDADDEVVLLRQGGWSEDVGLVKLKLND